MKLHLEETSNATPGRQAPAVQHRDLALLATYLDRGGYYLVDFYPETMSLRALPGLPGESLSAIAQGSVEDFLSQRIRRGENGAPAELLKQVALDGVFDLSTDVDHVGQFRVMTRVVGQGHLVVLLIPVTDIAPAVIAGSGPDAAYWREKLFDLVLFGSGAAGSVDQAEEHGLSKRMVECLRWTAVGKTSEEIAMILDLSSHTVNNYLSAATQKLNAVNRVQAVAYAITLGIIAITPKS